jgi:hypothetical protein
MVLTGVVCQLTRCLIDFIIASRHRCSACQKNGFAYPELASGNLRSANVELTQNECSRVARGLCADEDWD